MAIFSSHEFSYLLSRLLAPTVFNLYTSNQSWAISGFARQYQYQYCFCGQRSVNTNININIASDIASQYQYQYY